MKFSGVAYTDPGTKKKVNQDSYSVQIARTQYGDAVLAIVCDGVGGLKSGEQASATIVKNLSDWFENEFPKLINNQVPLLKIKEILFDIIQHTHSVLKKYGKEKGIQLGTTIAMFLSFSDNGLLINVGDSRVYCFRNGKPHLLSRDQTVAQREVEKGKLSHDAALKDKRSHILLQCIGASETVEPEFSLIGIEQEDSFLICTDGFYRKTMESELVFNIGSSAGFVENKAKQALSLISENVKNRGETDNITAVVIKAL